MINENILNKAFELHKKISLTKSDVFHIDAHIQIADLGDEITEMCGGNEELANWYICLALNLNKEDYEMAETFRNKILDK